MGIVNSEIVARLSADRTQTDSAGGRMVKTSSVPQSTIGAVFSDIEDDQRLNGQVGANAIRSKLHFNVENSENRTYGDGLLFIGELIKGDYVASIIKGTDTNTWGDVNTDRKYGSGALASVPVYDSGNDQTPLVVNTRGASYAHFQAGDKIVITNKASTYDVNFNLTDATGSIEEKTIQSVTWSGDQATIIVPGNLRYSYATSRTVNSTTVLTRVCSCAEYSDVKVSFSTANLTSAAGTVDSAALTGDNLGAIAQTITLTFSSGVAFNASSDVAGVSLVGGNISTTYSPLDSSGNAYLNIPPAFFGGTWQAGDSVQVLVSPAAMPVFWVIDVPAGSSPTENAPALTAIWRRGKNRSA